YHRTLSKRYISLKAALFFFFQAEDGIRDDLVTGVQTCALPNLPAGGFYHRMGDLGYFDEQGRLWFCGRKSHRVVTPAQTMFTIRSEERRVGKECRFPGLLYP